MARSSRARGGAGGGRRAQSKAKSRKAAPAAAPVADVEIVEEKKGMGIDDGLPIMTAVILVTAFLLVDYMRGTLHGEGLFFGG